MWSYAANVLYPSVALKEGGLYHPARIGVRPPQPATSGLGRHYSRSKPFPVLLDTLPDRYELVEEFDLRTPRAGAGDVGHGRVGWRGHLRADVKAFGAQVTGVCSTTKMDLIRSARIT